MFKISASVASLSGASQFVIEIADQKVGGEAPQTSGWDQFKEIDLGKIELKQSGEQEVKIYPKDPKNWKPMNLRFVKLTKTDS